MEFLFCGWVKIMVVLLVVQMQKQSWNTNILTVNRKLFTSVIVACCKMQSGVMGNTIMMVNFMILLIKI